MAMENRPVEDVFPVENGGFSIANVSLLKVIREYYLLLRQWLMMNGWRFESPQPFLTDGTEQGTILLHCLGSTHRQGPTNMECKPSQLFERSQKQPWSETPIITEWFIGNAEQIF